MTLFADTPSPSRQPTPLDAIVEAAFAREGVRALDDHRELHYDGDMFERSDKLLIRGVKFGNWTSSFLYKDFASGLQVPMACHRQVRSGSTDQKLMYVIERLANCQRHGFWLILDGRGFSKKMIDATFRKIAQLNAQGETGHLIINEGSFLELAIERLVKQNEI